MKRAAKPASAKRRKKSATVPPADTATPVAAPPPATSLVLRTCTADMRSPAVEASGFSWPKFGPVEAPDWSSEPKCGGGLHGLLWGDGDWDLLRESPGCNWLIVEVATDSIVDLGGRVKFPRGNVVFCSTDKATAIARILCGRENFDRLVAIADKASSGNGSKSASSGSGSTSASSGSGSTSASSGDYSKSASSGDYSMSASSGDYSKSEQSGDSGIAAAIGINAQARAGNLGAIVVSRWVESEMRYRVSVGYVGENGVKPDTWYRAGDDGALVEVQS